MRSLGGARQCRTRANWAPALYIGSMPKEPRADVIMFDKAIEQQRTREVVRGFALSLADLGFVPYSRAGCVRMYGSTTARVWLQKFSGMPKFRVVMSFQAAGDKRRITECGDRFTYRGSPAGRKFDFNIRWGDDASDRCLREIRAFVEVVAMPWFEKQAAPPFDR